MDSKVALSMGNSSPVFLDSSSPIKAIRIDPKEGKDDASLATIPDLAWPSSWHEENEIGKIKSACQERKVAILQNENKKIKGERDLISKDLEDVQEKLELTKKEATQLRDLNSLLAIRLRKVTAENSANVTMQENTLKAKYEQEICALKKEIEMCHEKEDRMIEALESEREKYSQSCREWEARHSQLEERVKNLLQCTSDAALKPTNKETTKSMKDPAVHVMIVTIHQLAEELDTQNTNDENCDNYPLLQIGGDVNRSEESLDVIHELKPLESKHTSMDREPTTPPLTVSRSSNLDANAPEFVRPIPSNVSWADLVEDDSRWYEESDSEDSSQEKQPASNVQESDGAGSGWLSKKDQGEHRTFRAFGQYRTSSFDNSSKRTSKRSPGKQSACADHAAAGPGKPTSHNGARHTRHRSADRFPSCHSTDNSGPWPEWTAPGTDYGNVQKVSSGVLVVDRRSSRSSASASTGPRRTKSEVPQCKRHVAGYCKFQDRCWFRHD